MKGPRGAGIGSGRGIIRVQGGLAMSQGGAKCPIKRCEVPLPFGWDPTPHGWLIPPPKLMAFRGVLPLGRNGDRATIRRSRRFMSRRSWPRCGPARARDERNSGRVSDHDPRVCGRRQGSTPPPPVSSAMGHKTLIWEEKSTTTVRRR